VGDARTVLVTGASRGLGLASATHLYAQGWHVLAGMRSPDVGMKRLRVATSATGADPRLTPVTLDLDDDEAIAAAAKTVLGAVGAPYAVVHNAGVAATGSVEEMPPEGVEQVFSTNVFGPMRLTAELLPAMRAAGRGRIVVVSSVGGLRGMPGISTYSAAKGALERWAESLSYEIAPFGLGATVLVAGMFRTDILEGGDAEYGDRTGPYSPHYDALDRTKPRVQRMASPPERFALGLAKALDDTAPLTRHGVGRDAKLMVAACRFLPNRLFVSLIRRTTGFPKANDLRT
jgi:NAD(P)-dependent dehydrogenase (short-subunit alcohol dehydrogenase family)